MAATTYGGGSYAVVDESTNPGGVGLHMAELRSEETVEEAFAKNHEAEDIGVALFNRQLALTGRGVTVTRDSIPGAPITAALDLADTGIIPTGLDEIWVNRSELANTNNDFQEGSFAGAARIGISLT